MRAVILAAGVGRRMEFDGTRLPKVMLPFGGRTLLRRHVDILRHCGVEEIVVAAGYRVDLIEAELADCGAADDVEVVINPDYVEGSIVTLWSVREQLARGGDVILMDGDVLYDYRIMERLLASRRRNCFLLDRDFEIGDEPTKLCVRDGVIVEFHKVVNVPFDFWGESVGFFRLGEDVARRLVPAAARYLEAGARRELYDEALRDILLGDPPGSFGFEAITGLPWMEIDFMEDVVRATAEVLPRLIEPGEETAEIAAAASGD
ncbi:MAG: phosphocholine cytidylyltransferase family protein [Alphaproteobacteria bacterium]